MGARHGFGLGLLVEVLAALVRGAAAGRMSSVQELRAIAPALRAAG